MRYKTTRASRNCSKVGDLEADVEEFGGRGRGLLKLLMLQGIFWENALRILKATGNWWLVWSLSFCHWLFWVCMWVMLGFFGHVALTKNTTAIKKVTKDIIQQKSLALQRTITYPTKREVGKIIDSKVPKRYCICDRSQFRYAHELWLVNQLPCLEIRPYDEGCWKPLLSLDVRPAGLNPAVKLDRWILQPPNRPHLPRQTDLVLMATVELDLVHWRLRWCPAMSPFQPGFKQRVWRMGSAGEGINPH